MTSASTSPAASPSQTEPAHAPLLAVPAASYGSDPFGLICGFRFEPNVRGVPIDLDAARHWLRDDAAPAADDGSGFVWLHFNLSDAAAESWIRNNLDVAPEFFEALREGSRSTRIENVQDTLIAVVNDVAYEFAFDPSEIETLWVFVGPRIAVSARVHPLRSIDRLRQSVRDGCCFDSSIAFLARLMRDQGDVLVHIVREATLKVDSIEDALTADGLEQRRASLGRLRRVLVRLRRLLAPEPGALFRLLRLPPPWMSSRDIDELRQATEEFTLVVHDASELQERIKLLQEEIAAQLGERTNRSLFTLTVVTVLALPINIVAGLLGMNVGGIPLNQEPHGFWIVVGVVTSITILACWIAFRRKD